MIDAITIRQPVAPEESARVSEQGEYSKVLQGTPIHGLIASSTARGQIQVQIESRTNPIPVGVINIQGGAITIGERAIKDYGSQAARVLLILLDKATAQLPRKADMSEGAIDRGRVVRLTLDQYMQICGLKDKKEARKQLNKAIRVLYEVSIDWTETSWDVPEGRKRAKKSTQEYSERIADGISVEGGQNPVKNGAVSFRFSYGMAKYLCGAHLMPYPVRLLAINPQWFPNSFSLGWKLAALYHMNAGTKRQTEATVKTLLEAARGIPRYDEIAKGGEIYRRIIEPFNRDLTELKARGILSELWYYKADGTIIQPEALGSLTYTEFAALRVHYDFAGYPDRIGGGE